MIVLASALLSACGEQGLEIDPAQALPMPQDYFVAAERAFCNTHARCCDPSAASVDACAAFAESNAAALAEVISDMQLRYDARQAQACVRAIEEATADCGARPFLGVIHRYLPGVLDLPACYGVLTGSVSLGEICSSIEGVYSNCGARMACEAGVCVHTAQRDEECSGGLACARPLACLPSGVCGEPLSDGAPCQQGLAQCASGHCDSGGTCAVSRTVEEDFCQFGEPW